MVMMMKNADPRSHEKEHPWLSRISSKQGDVFSLINQSLDPSYDADCRLCYAMPYYITMQCDVATMEFHYIFTLILLHTRHCPTART